MSIPYTYNMVDFSGLDLATINFSVVPGIYDKIVDAIGDWGVAVFYNWFFGEIPIAPQHCQVTLEDGYLMINNIIKVTEDDRVGVEGIVPSSIVEELNVTENGEYSAPHGVDGYNPVKVAVPDPPLQEKVVNENGIVTPDAGFYGLSSVNVNVSAAKFTIISTKYGEFVTGWYSSRRINRILSDGSKLLPLIWRFDSGYTCGAFYTLRDYGAVGNVINGDLVVKETLNDFYIPSLGNVTLYAYGGMSGCGMTPPNIKYYSNNVYEVDDVNAVNISGNAIIVMDNTLSSNGLFGPTNDANFGNAFNGMSTDMKNLFYELILQTQ